MIRFPLFFKAGGFFNGTLAKGKGDHIVDGFFRRDMFFKQVFVRPFNGEFEIVYYIASGVV